VRVLDRLCKMGRLEDVTPHTLRYTFASDLGLSELTIAALLGHPARRNAALHPHRRGAAARR